MLAEDQEPCVGGSQAPPEDRAESQLVASESLHGHGREQGRSAGVGFSRRDAPIFTVQRVWAHLFTLPGLSGKHFQSI